MVVFAVWNIMKLPSWFTYSQPWTCDTHLASAQVSWMSCVYRCLLDCFFCDCGENFVRIYDLSHRTALVLTSTTSAQRWSCFLWSMLFCSSMARGTRGTRGTGYWLDTDSKDQQYSTITVYNVLWMTYPATMLQCDECDKVWEESKGSENKNTQDTVPALVSWSCLGMNKCIPRNIYIERRDLKHYLDGVCLHMQLKPININKYCFFMMHQKRTKYFWGR